MLIRNIILLSIVFLGFTTLLAQDILDYQVNKISSPITIDGYLNEVQWNDAYATSNFVVLGSATPPLTLTWAKLLWDNTYIYVAFCCQDTTIWATLNHRDNELYTEDAVEVYFDPDGDGLNYIELEVNPLNTIFDLWMTKPWDSGGTGHKEWNFNNISTAVAIRGTVANNSDRDTAWTCEMAIPFAEMQFCAPTMNFPPLTNDIWRSNLYRFDRKSTNDPNTEQTGWNQTGGGQHVPDKFGRIIFTDNSTSNLTISNTGHSPEYCILYQNYPNPFNPITFIKYYLPQSGNISLKIYNLLGQEIAILADGYKTAGEHVARWNARDLPSSVYICRLVAGKFSAARKLIMQK
jgi:hypothetical protein